MQAHQCWAVRQNGQRCENSAEPGAHWCHEHGHPRAPHPAHIWRAPLDQMPPDLVLAIRSYWPAAPFPVPDPLMQTPLPPTIASVQPQPASPKPPPVDPPVAFASSDTLSVSPCLRVSTSAPEPPVGPHGCTHRKENGEPCEAHARPGRPFCAIHDPELAEVIAAGRSKGGAASRRRVRRFPRLLDHRHVAELLGELLIDALNDPEQADPRRLQAFTALARVVLQAVGVPRKSYLAHSRRTEPSPLEPHLLRVYAPMSAEQEALLDQEQPPPEPDPAAPEPLVLSARAAAPVSPAPSETQWTAPSPPPPLQSPSERLKYHLERGGFSRTYLRHLLLRDDEPGSRPPGQRRRVVPIHRKSARQDRPNPAAGSEETSTAPAAGAARSAAEDQLQVIREVVQEVLNRCEVGLPTLAHYVELSDVLSEEPVQPRPTIPDGAPPARAG